MCLVNVAERSGLMKSEPAVEDYEYSSVIAQCNRSIIVNVFDCIQCSISESLNTIFAKIYFNWDNIFYMFNWMKIKHGKKKPI